MFLNSIKSVIEMGERMNMVCEQPHNNDVRYRMSIRFSSNAHPYRYKILDLTYENITDIENLIYIFPP